VEDLLAARIKDFRLDPQLKRMCNVDIDVSLCSFRSAVSVPACRLWWQERLACRVSDSGYCGAGERQSPFVYLVCNNESNYYCLQDNVDVLYVVRLTA